MSMNQLNIRKANLMCQLEIIQGKLDVFEELDQQRKLYGEGFLYRQNTISKEVIDDFLSGSGWPKAIEDYKSVYNELFRIESILCQEQKGYREPQ